MRYMAIIGRFIGVAEYIDPRAPELPGARRDATAMWSLFADTLPDSDFKLILDKEATVENVKTALQETLVSADKEDSVIFYFAGHGSPDHRLVVHNTISELWGDTTISFEELSLLFKNSKAKSIICIFDCCFSGGITARVFENAPIPRTNSASLQSFAGEGKVIIAAADFNEPSFEIPTTGHGLFTKSLLDVLQNLEDFTDIQVIASKVMEVVRGEGAKLGLTQTPVIFGEIRGGLLLPKFFRGVNFTKNFPESSSIIIGKDVEEMTAFNIPKEILAAWKQNLKDGLNELQLEAINEHRILDGTSLMVVAPTSSGKTFVGEIAAAKAIIDGKKVVFLLPYRALVNEKFEYFEELYGSRLGMRVLRCTGDYSDQTSAFVKGKYDIAVLTYEMFLGLSVNNKAVLNSIGLVVLDEAQFITDPTRGITVELLLTQLNASKEFGVNPQIITLSATVGDINHFNEWLGLKILKTDNRPVPLTEGVLDRTGVFQYRTPTGEEKTEQLLPHNSIRIRRDKPGSQDVIVPLVKKLISSPEEKVIIFRNRRGPASGCAKYLADELMLPSANDEISQLPSFDLTDTSSNLRICFGGGTAFHSADLNREERVLVERAFRASHDHIRVLSATTTVAAGINTPASTVILVEHEFHGQQIQPYTVAEYKNMAGRAGRLGFKEEGKSILLAETPSERNLLFRKYILGTPEAINSSFSEENLMTWLLRLLAQIKQVSRADATRLLANTFGGYLHNRKNPNWQQTLKIKIEQLISILLEHKLLEEQDGFIRLTQFGIICGQSTLSFDSIIRIIDLIAKNGNRISNLDELILLTQALNEVDERYIPFAKNETRWPSQAETFVPNAVHLLRYYTQDALSFGKRSKKVSVLFSWIQGVSMETIQKTHSANMYNAVAPGDIRGIADLTRFNLRSVYQITSARLEGICPEEKELDDMLRRLEVGIPKEGIFLLKLPIPLERGEYLELLNQGILSVEDYWKRTPMELKSILGIKADLLEIHRPK
jgi:replicative superfamily II helicase